MSLVCEAPLTNHQTWPVGCDEGERTFFSRELHVIINPCSIEVVPIAVEKMLQWQKYRNSINNDGELEKKEKGPILDLTRTTREEGLTHAGHSSDSN